MLDLSVLYGIRDILLVGHNNAAGQPDLKLFAFLSWESWHIIALWNLFPSNWAIMILLANNQSLCESQDGLSCSCLTFLKESSNISDVCCFEVWCQWVEREGSKFMASPGPAYNKDSTNAITIAAGQGACHDKWWNNHIQTSVTEMFIEAYIAPFLPFWEHLQSLILALLSL